MALTTVRMGRVSNSVKSREVIASVGFTLVEPLG